MGSVHLVVDQILKEVWPKGLVGLLVPAIQFAWKLYRERGPEHRRKALRQDVTELRKFLESLSNTDESPETEASRQAARKELDEKVAALAALAAPTRDKPGVPAAPTRQIQPVPALAAPAALPPETADSTAAPAPAPAMGGSLRRWFLFYTPSRSLAWLPHTLFFVSLAGLLLTVPVALAQARQEPGVIAAPFVWLVLTLLFRAWAAILEGGDIYGLRRRFLLYAPSRPIGWLPRCLFYVSLFSTLLVAIALPFLLLSAEMRDREMIFAMASGLLFWLLLTLAFRAWGAALDRQPSDPPAESAAGLRRWLLLYVPSPPLVLILHFLFYLGPFFFYIGLDTYFLSPSERVVQIDPAGHVVDMQASLALPLVYLVWAILVIRDWAASFHPAGYGARERLRWLFLGRPSRRVGFIPRILYYLAALLLPLAIFTLFEDEVNGGLSWTAPFHAWRYFVWVTLPCTMVAISARGWARSLDAATTPPKPAGAGLADWIRKALLLDAPPDRQVWLVRSDLGLVLLLLILAARQPAAVEPLRLVLTVGLVLLAAIGWAASLRRGAL